MGKLRSRQRNAWDEKSNQVICSIDSPHLKEACNLRPNSGPNTLYHRRTARIQDRCCCQPVQKSLIRRNNPRHSTHCHTHLRRRCQLRTSPWEHLCQALIEGQSGEEVVQLEGELSQVVLQ